MIRFLVRRSRPRESNKKIRKKERKTMILFVDDLLIECSDRSMEAFNAEKRRFWFSSLPLLFSRSKSR